MLGQRAPANLATCRDCRQWQMRPIRAWSNWQKTIRFLRRPRWKALKMRPIIPNGQPTPTWITAAQTTYHQQAGKVVAEDDLAIARSSSMLSAAACPARSAHPLRLAGACEPGGGFFLRLRPRLVV